MNAHVLDGDKEELLSHFSTYSRSGSDLYDNLATADRSLDKITLSTGEEVVVTQGNWRSLIQDVKTAEDRASVFEAVFK